MTVKLRCVLPQLWGGGGGEGRRENEHPALCPRNKQSWLQTQCMSINVGVIAQLAPPATNYSPDTIHM